MEDFFSDIMPLYYREDIEYYKFNLVDDLYDILQYSTDTDMYVDFKDKTLGVCNDERNVYDMIVNVSDSGNVEHLLHVNRNGKQISNYGTYVSRVFIKENRRKNYYNDSEIFNDIERKAIQPKMSQQNSDLINRKRPANQMMDYQPQPKRAAVEREQSSDDELGFRSVTRPKVTKSFPMKKKIAVLDDLKSGKSIKQISNAFNISEEMILHFQQNETEIRRQFFSIMSENQEMPSSKPSNQNSINISNNQSRQSIVKPLITSKHPNIPNKSIIEQNNRRNSSGKNFFTMDCEIHNENGKLIFSNESIKKVSVNWPAVHFQLPKNDPNFPRPPRSNNSVKKSMTETSIHKSNRVDKIDKPITNQSQMRDNPNNRQLISNDHRDQSKSNRMDESIKKSIDIDSETKPPRNDRPYQAVKTESVLQQKKPIDPVKPQLPQPVSMATTIPVIPKLDRKPSVIKDEFPVQKKSSPFTYVVIDPSTTQFKPASNPDGEIRSTNVESEQFIDEACVSYERFSECMQIYELYNRKRDELRSRAAATKTEREISELYKEFNHLIDEEKMPFFKDLEREVTVLHGKLSKVASLMGIKLS